MNNDKENATKASKFLVVKYKNEAKLDDESIAPPVSSPETRQKQMLDNNDPLFKWNFDEEDEEEEEEEEKNRALLDTSRFESPLRESSGGFDSFEINDKKEPITVDSSSSSSSSEKEHDEEDDVFTGEMARRFNEQKEDRELEGQDTITSLSNNIYLKQLEKIKRKSALIALKNADRTSNLNELFVDSTTAQSTSNNSINSGSSSLNNSAEPKPLVLPPFNKSSRASFASIYTDNETLLAKESKHNRKASQVDLSLLKLKKKKNQLTSLFNKSQFSIYSGNSFNRTSIRSTSSAASSASSNASTASPKLFTSSRRGSRVPTFSAAEDPIRRKKYESQENLLKLIYALNSGLAEAAPSVAEVDTSNQQIDAKLNEPLTSVSRQSSAKSLAKLAEPPVDRKRSSLSQLANMLNNRSNSQANMMNLTRQSTTQFAPQQQQPNLVIDELSKAIRNDPSLYDKELIENVIKTLRKEKLKQIQKRNKTRRVCFVAQLLVFFLMLLMTFFLTRIVMVKLKLIAELDNTTSMSSHHTLATNNATSNVTIGIVH